MRAIELVLERVNEAGGVGGRPVVLDVYDDANDPEPLDPGFECVTPTKIIVGEVIEFTSPDDLLLDPAQPAQGGKTPT